MTEKKCTKCGTGFVHDNPRTKLCYYCRWHNDTRFVRTPAWPEGKREITRRKRLKNAGRDPSGER